MSRISNVFLLAFGFGVSAFISNILRDDFQGREAAYINIIAIAILIVSFVLCFTMLLVVSRKKAGMEQMNMENRSIIESRQNYVQEILNDREEIRRMYHDLDKIVLTLNTLLEGGQKACVVGVWFLYHTFQFIIQCSGSCVCTGGQQQVSLHIKQNQDQWYLRVENTYCVESSITAFTYSTKSGGQHGYGIKNICEAADRLGVEVHFKAEEAYVVAEVFLAEN